MRASILVAVVVGFGALGCAKKEPPLSEEAAAIAKVCKHIVDTCGKMSNYDVCVTSTKAMRAANLEGAKEAEACALSKTACQDISMCSMKSSKKIIRTSLRRIDEKLEKAKQELDPPAPSSPGPGPAPAPEPTPAR